MSELVVIVAGGSRGIGRAVALKLTTTGYSVVVNYASASGEAQNFVKAISAVGGRARAVRADVSSADEIG